MQHRGASEPGARPHRILVVEDDADIRELVVHVLEEEGREVVAVGTGAEALARARDGDPDLVTLDLTLPDADGVEVCRGIRQFSDAYIVMITGRDDQVDRLQGLDVGADEYLAKPFSPPELRARVSALLRRPRLGMSDAAPAPAARVELGGGLVLDQLSRTATLDGAEVPLAPFEHDVLVALADRAGEAVSRADLAAQVWHGEAIESDFQVDVAVGNLRRKLRRAGAGHDWIQTVGGSGYELRRP